MKLNPDCVREILLAVEKICNLNTCFDSNHHSNEIHGNYSCDEIQYHSRQCELLGLFYKYNRDLSGKWCVIDLSPKGHDFLANIREETVWKQVKDVSTNVGSKSLTAITQIASSVISDIIKSQLGLR